MILTSLFVLLLQNACPLCDTIVCSDCITNKVTLPEQGNRKTRACDSCYGIVTGVVGETTPLMQNADK